MITIGIDPDLHDTAIAAWGPAGPIGAYMVSVSRRKGVIENTAALEMAKQFVSEVFDGLLPDWWSDAEVVAVEAQTLHRAGPKQHKRPQDIVTLGQVAGAILTHCVQRGPTAVRFPTPEQWKGQIPKNVMQARMYNDLGWGYQQAAGYSIPRTAPEEFGKFSKQNWKHIGDALLLARWAQTN